MLAVMIPDLMLWALIALAIAAGALIVGGLCKAFYLVGYRDCDLEKDPRWSHSAPAVDDSQVYRMPQEHQPQSKAPAFLRVRRDV